MGWLAFQNNELHMGYFVHRDSVATFFPANYYHWCFNNCSLLCNHENSTKKIWICWKRVFFFLSEKFETRYFAGCTFIWSHWSFHLSFSKWISSRQVSKSAVRYAPWLWNSFSYGVWCIFVPKSFKVSDESSYAYKIIDFYGISIFG